MSDPISAFVAQEITKTFLVELTKGLASSLLNSTWSNDTLDGKHVLSQLELPHISQKYVDNYASNVLKMRTLWSDDADIYLDSIYTPLSITAASNKDVITIEDNEKIRSHSIVNIIGIAGQGKSTILRKLFFEELKLGQKIPFFLELRRLENGDILNYLRGVLTDIGCSLKDGYLEFLLQSGKVILMLDGFDEVKSSERPLILARIIQLKERYNCQVITTSRPETEICSEVGICNFYVNKLEEQDILNIIGNFKIDSDAISELPDLIRENDSLRQTLVTPILVNLLCVCYPALGSVPDNVKDFYSSLFVTLYSKHDKLKNYKRETKAKIPVMESYDIFNAFCFFTLKSNVFEFTETDLVDHFSKAKKLVRIDKVDPRDAADDIVHVTCLIQRDGYNNFVFLHKSVQEFHAAMFIHRFRSNKKSELFNYLGNILVSKDNLDNLATYLKQLNHDDYQSNILIPVFERFNINKFAIDKDSIIHDLIRRCFSKATITLVLYEKDIFDLEENVYGLENFTSLEHNTVLTGLSFIATGSRNISNHYDTKFELDFLILDSFEIYDIVGMRKVRGISESVMSEDIRNKAVAKVSKDILLLNGREQIEQITYRVPLLDFLESTGNLEQLKTKLSNYLSYLYHNHYVPCYKYFEESDLVFELELDFD